MNANLTQPMGIQCPNCGADDWTKCDNSFDHQFGTECIGPYLSCNCCNHEADMPEGEY